MILVTGGSGYIGSVLVRRLLERGDQVRVLDAGFFGHESIQGVRAQIDFVEGDIRTCKKDVVADVEAVIHCAGFSNDPTAEYRPKENFSVNVDGTRNIVNLSKEAGVKKFIFMSSCSVYYTTNPDDESEKSEDDVITPTAPYSLSKHMAEDIVMAARSSNFLPTVFRQGTVYGVSPRMRYDLAVNCMILDAIDKKKMTIHQGGRMWRPFVDIETVAAAHLYALEIGIEGTYNLLDMNIRISELAKLIQNILLLRFNERIGIEVQEVGVSRSYRVSGDRLKARGFKGRGRSFEEAVCGIWQDLKQRSDLDDPKYYNIRVFEQLFSNKPNVYEREAISGKTGTY